MINFTVKCFMNEKENHICDDICDFLSSISYLVVQTQHLYNLCLTQQTAFISTVLTVVSAAQHYSTPTQLLLQKPSDQ